MPKTFTEIEAYQTATDLAFNAEDNICAAIGIDEVDSVTSDALYELVYGLIFRHCTITSDN